MILQKVSCSDCPKISCASARAIFDADGHNVSTYSEILVNKTKYYAP